MKQGMPIAELEREVVRQQQLKQDFIAPTSLIRAVSHTGMQPKAITIGGDKEFGITDLAHSQIAQYLQIPLPYYRRMLDNTPDLWQNSVNTWLDSLPRKRYDEKRLVRTLGRTVRAFLSDRYRPLEHIDLLAAAMPSLRKLDLRILSSQITETRLYIKATTEEGWEKVKIARKERGEHAAFEWFSPAICLSNSEVGHGALSLEIGLFTKGCTNLAWMPEKSLRKYHLGGRLGDLSDDVVALLTDDTKRATDQALWMQFRDVLNGALDRDAFKQLTAMVVEGKRDELPADNVVQSVTFACKQLTIDEDEAKQVLGHLIKSGDLTRYGLFQAVTRTAEDVPEYDRATDLERIGGKVLELSDRDWRVIREAA